MFEQCERGDNIIHEYFFWMRKEAKKLARALSPPCTAHSPHFVAVVLCTFSSAPLPLKVYSISFPYFLVGNQGPSNRGVS